MPLVEQDVVRQMRTLAEAGWGAKSIARAESEGQLKDKLNFFAKPKLLVIDELVRRVIHRRG